LKIYLLLILFTSAGFLYSSEGKLDLASEYSEENFQKGVRSFHNTEYELAITHLLKSLSYKDDNKKARRYFLGESYRKAGHIDNALYAWNMLLSTGYDDRGLKNRVSYIYNKRGMLTDIFVDKEYILREDIKGFNDDKKLPIFIKPSQIAVDKNNHYYIASYLTGTIVELDSNFKVVRNFISPFPKIENPFGVAVDKEGYLFVSDFKNDVIYKLSKLNTVEQKIGFKGIGDGALLGPKNLLLDDDENLYVSDTGNKRINKYKKSGEILFSFGDEKSDEGWVKTPCGLYYYDGKIFVCDRDSNRIVVFDKNGNFLFSFGEDKLDKPYDITRDKLGRFLILCKDKLWAFEENNSLWYTVDASGSRIRHGISLVTDKENNILITDFDESRLLVLSLERQRYSNLNVNVERVLSQKFPEVHLAVTIEKDDGSYPVGIDVNNLSVYENGKHVSLIGNDFTKVKDKNSDILILYDKTVSMSKNTEDFKILLDKWIKSSSDKTTVCVVSTNDEIPVIESEFNTSRLKIIESLSNRTYSKKTDKGAAIKFGIYHMLYRFSKKTIIIVTDSKETGNDFEKYKLSECVELAKNNDIKIYVVSFGDGPLSESYKFLAKKTEGDYYRVYKRNDLQDLFKTIESSKGHEMIISYISRSISRFGDEPISVYLDVNYGGMKGVTKTWYFPGRKN